MLRLVRWLAQKLREGGGLRKCTKKYGGDGPGRIIPIRGFPLISCSSWRWIATLGIHCASRLRNIRNEQETNRFTRRI